MKIASRRQNVTEINISDCRGVHDHGVSSLASHCPSLQKYTAYRCKQLGDESLSALATHCTLLAKVHVGNQDKLTDESLKKVCSCGAGYCCCLKETVPALLFLIIAEKYLQLKIKMFLVYNLNYNFVFFDSFSFQSV